MSVDQNSNANTLEPTPEIYMIADLYNQGKVNQSRVRSVINKRYKRLEPLGPPPEGYYYPDASKVADYNRQVYEYNKAINKYRQDLVNAIVEGRSRPTAPSAPSGIPGYARVEAAAMQRAHVDREYPVFPSEPEPIERYGPLQGPKPGSIGEKLSEKLSPIGTAGLELLDSPWQRVTQPMRTLSEDLRESAVKRAEEKKPLQGLTEYMAGVGLSTLAAGVDVASYPLRPQLWVNMGITLGGLAVSPAVRGALWKEIKSDPFLFSSEVVGGALVGGVIDTQFHNLLSETRTAYKLLKAQRGSTFEGMYGTSVKEPSYGQFLREYQATRAARKTPELAESSLSRLEKAMKGESGISEFPPETAPEISYSLFERKTLKVKTDTPSKEWPQFEQELTYYSPVEPSPGGERAYAQFIENDLWSPKLIKGSKKTALPYTIDGEGGFVLVDDLTGPMKPFKDKLPSKPRFDEWTPSLTGGAPDTPVSALIKKANSNPVLGEKYWFPSGEIVTESMYRSPEILTSKTIKEPGINLKTSILDKVEFKTVNFEKVKFDNAVQLRNVEKITNITLDKNTLKETSDTTQRFITKLDIPQLPKDIPVQKPVPDITLKEVQLPDLTFKLDLPEIQLPILDTPPYEPEKQKIPRFVYDPPSQPKTKRYKGDPLTPRGKKGKKRKRKEVWEKRIDIKTKDINLDKIMGKGLSKKLDKILK